MAIDTATRDARRMWTLFESIHAVTYFAPHVPAAFEQVGLRGFWRSYFAGRAAPLGPVGPAPVTALFFNFAPAMVARALPDVWTRITPEQALQARVEGTTAALREAFRDLGPDALNDIVASLEFAAGQLNCAGRALAAAYAALPRPDDPLARLWWATTVLREHRGDGHVAALMTTGVDGCQALVWRAARDDSRVELQTFRGWTDEEWSRSQEALVARGWVTLPERSPLSVPRHIERWRRRPTCSPRLPGGSWAQNVPSGWPSSCSHWPALLSASCGSPTRSACRASMRRRLALC